jgi:hypothetical protein
MATSFFDEVFAFVEVLDAGGYRKSARAVEDAVRGGATGGEILANLGVALVQFLAETSDADGDIRAEATRLLDAADRALRAVGHRPPPR